MKRGEPGGPEGLVVDVARLAEGGESLAGEIPAEALGYDSGDFFFKPASGLRYRLFVQLLGEELLVRGRVEEDFICMCVRCTAEFPWTAVDGEVSFALEIGGDPFADLTNGLRECIILSFPSHPVCQADCKGLCPRCGADLNKGTCSCKPGGDSRWGALDGFATE